MQTTNYNKQCKFCNKQFISHRIDKIFCNRLCKNSYRDKNNPKTCIKCGTHISLSSKGYCKNCKPDNLRNYNQNNSFFGEKNHNWKGGMMDETFYRKQIEGLWLILNDADKDNFMISREYVKEKLRMILSGGINFHPSIKSRIGVE